MIKISVIGTILLLLIEVSDIMCSLSKDNEENYRKPDISLYEVKFNFKTPNIWGFTGEK